MTERTYREEIFRFVKNEYGTEPEFPFRDKPDWAVLRHSDNRKWYAVVMRVPRRTIGIDDSGVDAYGAGVRDVDVPGADAFGTDDSGETDIINVRILRT